jgi:hypothetical protein
MVGTGKDAHVVSTDLCYVASDHDAGMDMGIAWHQQGVCLRRAECGSIAVIYHVSAMFAILY